MGVEGGGNGGGEWRGHVRRVLCIKGGRCEGRKELRVKNEVL